MPTPSLSRGDDDLTRPSLGVSWVVVRPLPRCLSPLSGLVLAPLVTACAGDLDDPARFVDAGLGVDSRTTMTEAVGDASCSAEAALAVPEVVFAATCTRAGCHNPTDLGGSLDLLSKGAVSALVGTAAHDGPGVYVSTDGDPSTSDLYLLLTPAYPFDNQMPLGGPYLDAGTLACVREWIMQQKKSPSLDSGSDVHDANAKE